MRRETHTDAGVGPLILCSLEIAQENCLTIWGLQEQELKSTFFLPQEPGRAISLPKCTVN